MRNITVKYTTLIHFWTCFFLDSENGNYPTINVDQTLKCVSQGKFLTGCSEKAQFYGHAICIGISIVIGIVGLFGCITNVFNALVLRKSLRGSTNSFRGLLRILAVFEFLACVFSIGFTTSVLTILENINRSEASFEALRLFHILYSFGRTAAVYVTLLVTIERYLVVAFPIKSKSWLTPTKSKIYLCLIIVIVLLLDLPWIFNSTVTKNIYIELSPNSTLVNFPYILNGTKFGRVVYPKVKYVLLLLNYVAPFPLLLIFNGLLYRSIFKWDRRRQALTRKQKKDIKVAKMFSIAVSILLMCHTISCIIFFSAQYLHVTHRELMFLQLLSVTVSASVNFVVYMCFGKDFRQEFKRLIGGKGEVPPIRQSNTGESSTPESNRSSNNTNAVNIKIKGSNGL